MSDGTSRRKRTASLASHVIAGAACAMLSWAGAADERAGDKPSFSADEIRTILSHGPWPAPGTHDPTNRVSGTLAAVEFGTRLFFDQRLSGTRQVSCATCHVPERNWSDNLRRGVGVAEVDRNTPTLMNLRGARWYGWDGASDSLWSQSVRPLLDARELAASPRHVAQLVRNEEELSCRYRKTFGAPPSPTDDEAVLVAVGKALAAFQETLVSGRTPFDQFRDALARGDPPASWRYSEPAQRGLKTFIGKGGCTQCHAGPNFTSGEFFDTGLSAAKPLAKLDPGRREGIRQLLQSRFNLTSAYNDDKSGASAVPTRALTPDAAHFGEVKVPSLRNLVLTAPYGRDGQIETIAEVVRHYAAVDPVRLRAKDGGPARPLQLSAREQVDLVVFLESLSTFSNPWRPDDGGRCE